MKIEAEAWFYKDSLIDSKLPVSSHAGSQNVPGTEYFTRLVIAQEPAANISVFVDGMKLQKHGCSDANDYFAGLPISFDRRQIIAPISGRQVG
jgi:hypothetical protein